MTSYAPLALFALALSTSALCIAIALANLLGI